MAERKGESSCLMLGKSGIGRDHPSSKHSTRGTTLFLDIEAGDLAVARLGRATQSVRPRGRVPRLLRVPRWSESQSLPPIGRSRDGALSVTSCAKVTAIRRSWRQLPTFFLDSITQLSRQCFAWCEGAAGRGQRPFRQA